MVADINDLYLNTEMKRYEYMQLWVDITVVKIIGQDSLRKVEKYRWIYIEIMKEM